MSNRQGCTVVGIDVGGAKKGYHAVAFTDGKYVGHTTSGNVETIAVWVKEQGAQVVAVDAPCGWSTDGGSRPCERELQRIGISSFYTPTRERAILSKRDFYGWVFNGEALYVELKAHFPLYSGGVVEAGRPFCFETFPHAITWQLRGGQADAKKKRDQRRELLEWKLGQEEAANLKGIDFKDAALCAWMAAHAVAGGSLHALGDVESGFLLVPEREVQMAGF
jgi:predicted nuclease with RNAse H fold